MAIWQRLIEIIDGGAAALLAVFEWAAAMVGGMVDPETRRQVAFSAAMIALSAKMAKADGVVTSDEVATFRRLFVVPPGEERHVARLFDIAKEDVAGYEAYATRVADFYGDDRTGLMDVMDGLFVIATADGAVHDLEMAYLENVASILSFDHLEFERIAARYVISEGSDPYLVLGVSRADTIDAIRRRYRALVREHHPDRAIARGVPPEMVAIAHERLAAINAAFERIEYEKRLN